VIVDLHNHTTLCNHATGSMREYINRAIEKNIDIFGFSDHAPMNYDTKYRMSFDDMQSYEESIKELADEYKDKIEIVSGYEVDWIDGYIDDRVINANVDYLIGSVHFLDGWGFDNPEFIGKYKEIDIDELWNRYFKTITKMVKSNMFDIVGHIDLIKVFKFLPTKDIYQFVEETLDTIAKSNMAIELNSAGYRKPIGEAYPSKEILQMAYDRNIPITIGSDAHSIEQVGMYQDKIYQFAKSTGYKKIVSYKSRVPIEYPI